MKYKLMTAFFVTLAPLLALGSYISYTYIERTYVESTRNELRQSANALAKMVETAATVAIRNYLRAVAEKNREVTEAFFQRYQDGELDRTRLIDEMHRFFASQQIGTTGYVYCIDSRGNAVYHPNPAVQGKSVLAFDFVKEQIATREGYLTYDWKNPDEPRARAKALYMTYFQPLDWIISVSSYRDEFLSLVNLDDIRDNVISLRLGRSGYAFIMDRQGRLLIHPQSRHARKVQDIIPGDPDFLTKLGQRRHGDLVYDYQDPVTGQVRPKMAYFSPVPEFGWFVGTTYFVDEVFRPLKTIQTIILVTSAAIFLLSVGVAIWFSAYANSHIKKLVAALEKGASGVFDLRLRTRAEDEFGKLVHFFNLFMERLESYQRSLLDEIDKRREMQAAVYASEQRIKSLVQNSPVLLWAVDRDGVVTFYEGALPAPIEVCECNPLGQSLARFWERCEALPEHIDHALAGRSGSLLSVQGDHAVEVHYNPLAGSDESIDGAVGVAIDVTARWQAERRLDVAEQERRKLVMAVEQAAEIIVITNRAGIIEYVNPAFEKVSGYTSAEVIGQKPGILKSGSHDRQFYVQLWRTISAGQVWSGRFINKRKDGTLYYEEARISPLRDENGRIVHYVAAKRDVTSEISLERQLQHSDRMKAIGTLAGGIAHDFNNILSGIMGYTELCLQEAPRQSPLCQRLEKVMQAGLRARELIRHIQTFSRQSSIEPVTMLPAPMVNEALKLIRASFPAAIRFEIDIQKVGVMFAVPAQIHQIVMNLCTNACQAMAQGGTLSVTLRRQIVDATSAGDLPDLAEGVYAVLSVGDTGHGIPQEIVAKIFDPYFTTKGDNGGSGLGLAMVHGIVKNMGGAVKVHSEPGKSTTFTVYLPLVESAEEITRSPKGDLPMGRGQSILLIDDDAYVMEATQGMLQGLGYRVTACSGAAEALNLFEAHPREYDMVITDYALPRMNGAQLAQRLKQIRCDLPLLICTGFSSDDELAVLEKEGLATLINKPIIRMELAVKVNAGLPRGAV